jgi:Phage endonuclease I
MVTWSAAPTAICGFPGRFFELPGGIYIECKGYLRDEDRRKLELIRDQHPALDLRIIFA